MGGHGHHEYKIPDYKIYQVDDAPELVLVRKALAAKGLADPWLRNEVWRYRIGGTEKKRFYSLFFRGFKYGFTAFIASAVITKMLSSSEDNHHGDHHHKDHQ